MYLFQKLLIKNDKIADNYFRNLIDNFINKEYHGQVRTETLPIENAVFTTLCPMLIDVGILDRNSLLVPFQKTSPDNVYSKGCNLGAPWNLH